MKNNTELRIRKTGKKRKNLARKKNGRMLRSRGSGFSQRRHFICNNDEKSKRRQTTSGKTVLQKGLLIKYINP